MLWRPSSPKETARPGEAGKACHPNPSSRLIECPRQELNLVYDLRRVASRHHTPRTSACWSARRGASANQQAKEPTTGFAPAWSALRVRRLSVSSHVGIKQERKDSNPVRQFWRLLALPGARSCMRGGAEGVEPSPSGSQPAVQEPLHHRPQLKIAEFGLQIAVWKNHALSIRNLKSAIRNSVIPGGLEPPVFPMSRERPGRWTTGPKQYPEQESNPPRLVRSEV